MKGVRASLCARVLQPLPAMLRAVYTEHEILDAPKVWEPTSTSHGWDCSDLQKVWITTGSVGAWETQHEENTVFPLALLV